MNIIKIQVDDFDGLHILDDDNQQFVNEDEIIDYIWAKCEFKRIGRLIMQDADLSTNPVALANIGKIINNYFAEKEDFLEKNQELLMRLALSDTEEDINNGEEPVSNEDEEIIDW